MNGTFGPVTKDELWQIASEALEREAATRKREILLQMRLAQLLPIEEAVLEWLAAHEDPEDWGYRVDDAHDELKARARALDEAKRKEQGT